MYSGPKSDKSRPCRLSPGPIYAPDANTKGGLPRSPKYKFGTGLGPGALGSGTDATHYVPGPGEYEISGSVGQQLSSSAKTSPSYGWGTEARDTLGKRGAECDNWYTLNSSLGAQTHSKKNSSASYAFGTSQRFGDTRSDLRKRAATPGPGTYSCTQALRDQPDSTKRSNPKYGFSRATRFGETDSNTPSRTTPGPDYSLRTSVGSQVQSERKSPSSWGFGTAQRFPGGSIASRQPTPGPGSYNA